MIRQLNCATRSSQAGTSAGSGGAGNGSTMVFAAPATAMTTAVSGTAANRPMMPASSKPAGSATSTRAGWMLTVRPYTSGRTKEPRMAVRMPISKSIAMAGPGPSAARVTSRMMAVVTMPPKYGM